MSDLRMSEAQRDALREPFPASSIGTLPKAGIKLSYVGHAAVTDRLLKVDPEWTWEPMATDAFGNPALVLNAEGYPVAMWIRLTVCGVTRPGVGTVLPKAQDAEKQLISDAIRNAAMRFGVALDLWSKEELTPPAEGAAPRRSHRPNDAGFPHADAHDGGTVATGACSICGSTRSERVLVRGITRCAIANDCKKRAEEAQAVPSGEEPF